MIPASFEVQFMRTAAFWLWAKQGQVMQDNGQLEADVNDRVLALIGELDARAELWRICEEVKQVSKGVVETVCVPSNLADRFAKYLEANGVVFERHAKNGGSNEVTFKGIKPTKFLHHSFMKRNR